MIKPLQRLRAKSSLRYKLLVLVLAPLLLLTGTVILLAAQWSTQYTYEQLYTKVNTDLRVAHDIFLRIQSDRLNELASLADSTAFLDRLEQNDEPQLLALLSATRQQGHFDFLNLWSADGSRRLQQNGWKSLPLRSSPLTDRLLQPLARDADGVTGIEIYSADEWQLEDAVSASKVVFPLVETPRAVPTNRTQEDRAMVIYVLQRVLDRNGAQIALLEGGSLLNRNFAFVDEIRDLVYGPGSLAAGSRGTVTVFLEDVRISTNVPAKDTTRALGTRVSEEVRNAVLEQGNTWVNRAFVVNDWYISAYEPIIDVYGKRVGMLYAGYLEAPFRSDLMRAIAVLSGIVIAGSLLAVVAAAVGAESIFKPIQAMAKVARATAAGERLRINRINSSDELGELATQFNSMLDTQEEHRALIERDSHELERTVQRRTAELQLKNRRLEESIDLLHQTRRQLAMAEKLAAIGEVTAGVAHEINNPTAVILGNMDILIAEIGKEREDVKTEIDLIIEQVYRIRSITDRLLQYSRSPARQMAADEPSYFSTTADWSDQLSDASNEFDSPPPAPVDISEVLTESMLLVRHELDQKQLKMTEHHGAVARVLIDRQELQQVLVNLLINAVQAVDADGVIELTTSRFGENQVCIAIKDNGSGIDPAHMQRLFDPFFTSGKERGTGLGLSVSYGIVTRYGGTIDVESTPGEGAIFRVFLPLEDAKYRKSATLIEQQSVSIEAVAESNS